MSWFMTAGPEEFLTVAGEFLRAEPARNSVMLTVTADLLAAGPAAGPAGMPRPSPVTWPTTATRSRA